MQDKFKLTITRAEDRIHYSIENEHAVESSSIPNQNSNEGIEYLSAAIANFINRV